MSEEIPVDETCGMTYHDGNDDSGTCDAIDRHACFVIQHNVAKKHNIGTIARCATAFNVKAVCLVGSRHFNAFGAHGADAHVTFRHYPTLEECCDRLKSEDGCEIVGIEIDDTALPIQSHPFVGPTAFILGNEGQGLSERQIRCCDKLVYIPQYGCGTASLNVAVATSIVLHHFALWAGYEERERQGQKFVVAKAPQRTAPRGTVPLTAEEREALIESRRKRKELEQTTVANDDTTVEHTPDIQSIQ